MALSNEQQVQMAVDVGVIRTVVEGHAERLEKLESKVDAIDQKLNGHTEWKTSVNAGLADLKVGVEKCGSRWSLLDGLDKATVIKLLALVVAAILAGSAGGEAVVNLVKFIVGFGG